jgi:hypothetical protein
VVRFTAEQRVVVTPEVGLFRDCMKRRTRSSHRSRDAHDALSDHGAAALGKATGKKKLDAEQTGPASNDWRGLQGLIL